MELVGSLKRHDLFLEGISDHVHIWAPLLCCVYTCVCTWQEDLFKYMAVFVIKGGNLNHWGGFVDYFCLPPQSNRVSIYGDGSQECILNDPSCDFFILSYLRLIYLEGRWTLEWKWMCLWFSLSWLFVTRRTVVHQAPWSMEFSRQECWSG